jgi:molecular chaperone GrpE (heat shock protein)
VVVLTETEREELKEKIRGINKEIQAIKRTKNKEIKASRKRTIEYLIEDRKRIRAKLKFNKDYV